VSRCCVIATVVAAAVAATGLAFPADEPILPEGLGGEPGLPPGLGSEPSLPAGLESEPTLPAGLAEPGEAATDRSVDDSPGGGLLDELTGFAELTSGLRTRDDPNQLDRSILEARLHLQWARAWNSVDTNIAVDFVYDDVVEDHSIDLDTGDGWLDLREFNLLFRPADNADVKLGRQVLTWGTGDLIFINDLFPKDWNSFFIGRDVEYLKAPSDTAKLAVFSGLANIDFVYAPRFDADRYIDGRRISYYNPAAGDIVGRDDPVVADKPDEWFEDDEWHIRAYRNIGSLELAAYGYDGYWKNPGGVNPDSGNATFPRLSVYGASARRPLLAGIANAELGYYDSRDDTNGSNPLVRNSELRLLLGYEQELATELTGGLQWYAESMQDYGAYQANLPEGANQHDRNRHVITIRLTKLLMNQNLTVSLFNFYSPTDEDGYLRLKGSYKLTDAWQIRAGANLFYGQEPFTFFGQFEQASNLYGAVRYGF
jgi:hypothetical protein